MYAPEPVGLSGYGGGVIVRLRHTIDPIGNPIFPVVSYSFMGKTVCRL